MLWSNLIDVLRGSLFVLAHWCGGSLGAAILVASTTVRIGMMPLTLRSARRRLVRERALRDLAPELERIKRKHAARPDLAMSATQRLYDAHGIAMFDRRDALDALVQFPPAAALYAAIRGSAAQGGRSGFLWVHDLATPDRLLAVSAGLLTGIVTRLTMTAPAGTATTQLLPVITGAVVMTLVLWHVSAGVALYSIANSLIGGVERVVAARTLKPVVA